MLKRTATKHIGPGFCSQPLLVSTAIAALLCATGMRPASAQSVTGSGDLNPGPALSPNWTVGGDLRVGDAGVGGLDIISGGTVTNDFGTIGYGAGSNGTVTVSGTDGSGNASTWTNTSGLVVGQSGTGSLSILGGGKVSSQFGWIGDGTGSQGSVTVSGVDGGGNASTWTNVGSLVLGFDGTGTLQILAGGRVSNLDGIIRNGSSVLVSGLGSSWQNSGAVRIGTSGAGTLRVEGGATVSNVNGTIGDLVQGDAVVTGTGTTWTNTGALTIGQSGVGSLTILDGGKVSSDYGRLGDNAGSQGTVAVSGVDSSGNASTWTNTGDLVIGQFGTGSLTILSGGKVSNLTGYIAGDAGSQGTVTVSGIDGSGNASTWTNTGDLVIGHSGTGSLPSLMAAKSVA